MRLKKVEYTSVVKFCTVNEKPVNDLTWEEQVLDCPYDCGLCETCPKCEHIQKNGTTIVDLDELAF